MQGRKVEAGGVRNMCVCVRKRSTLKPILDSDWLRLLAVTDFVSLLLLLANASRLRFAKRGACGAAGRVYTCWLSNANE